MTIQAELDELDRVVSSAYRQLKVFWTLFTTGENPEQAGQLARVREELAQARAFGEVQQRESRQLNAILAERVAELTALGHARALAEYERETLLAERDTFRRLASDLRAELMRLTEELTALRQAQAHTPGEEPSPSDADPHGYYATLGLNPAELADLPAEVSQGIMQTAWRLQAKIHHPDLQFDTLKKQQAHVVMQRINRAYEALRCGTA